MNVAVRVVPVVDHVRCYEEPLRDRARVDIGSKVIEVADFGCAGWYRCHGVIEYQRVVFAYVERVRGRTTIQVVDRRVASIRLDMGFTR